MQLTPREPQRKRNQLLALVRHRVRYLACALLAGLSVLPAGWAQTAFISSAWWTFQQDCNGDGCRAGTLPGNMARLNWEPDVTNCNASLIVFEKVYVRTCNVGAWTPIYTNTPHSITGCRSLGQQYVDVPMPSGCQCHDYLIQIYRQGMATPDYSRSSTNDPALAQHREQSLVEDFCLSDYFATCAALSGSYGTISDNNITATKEPGEPAHAGNPGGHSLWYCWTTTTNTVVTFDTSGSSFDTLLAVYTGSAVFDLTLVASNDDIAGATNRLSSLTFTPVPGTVYHIAVDGFGGAAGNFVLNWNQSTKALPDLIVWGPATAPTITTRNFPSNDCEVIEGCATPGLHRLLTFSMETRNIGAGDLVIGSVTNNPLFIWASCHGHFHFEQFAQYDLLDTNGNVAATGHKVGFCLEDVKPWGQPGAPTSSKYNCNNQGIQRGWADVYSASLPCQYIDVTAVPPGEYVLQLTVNPDGLLTEARTDNNTAMVPLVIPPTNCPAPPPNDAFVNAQVITNTPFTFSAFNNCATKQSQEPNHAGDPGGHSLWFAWTPQSNQTARVTTKRSDFDTLLAVYTGNSVSALSLVASNDDIVDGTYKVSQLSFQAVAGTTYRIAVDGWGGAVGTAVLNLQPPVNDDFASAITIVGTAGRVQGSTPAASKEPYEPAHASDVGGHSVWYNWTAPAGGPVDFNTAGSKFDTTLAVYTGTIVTNLPVIASNDDDIEEGGLLTSRLWFFATQGTTYRIAVDGFGGDAGDYTLTWNMENRLGITALADGTVRVSMTGVDWHRYTLLGSTDLVHWATNIPTITLQGGIRNYTNSPATNGPDGGQQYFRAVRAP